MTTHTQPSTQIVLPGLVGPEGLVAAGAVLPAPSGAQALVAVEATGVSFAEQQMRRGKYFDQPPFPFVPGYDLVGRVVEVGPDADPALVGQRVAALTKLGAWAERVLVDAERLVVVPANVDAVTAEALIANGLTAHRMLHQLAEVRPGQTIVVHGATGGVGGLLVQLARTAGARVIGIAGPRGAQAVEAAGALWVDRHAATPDALADAVLVLAPSGVDAVFDHVGGPVLDASWRMLAPSGRLISYGTAATRDDAGDPMAPVMDIIGRLQGFAAQPGDRTAGFFNLWDGLDEDAAGFWRTVRDDLGALLAQAATGAVAPAIAGTWPLRDAGTALAAAEAGGLVGKVVLVTTTPAAGAVS
jgi:NADPH:quinone reductase-like Zn-dependent oxidoreductase